MSSENVRKRPDLQTANPDSRETEKTPAEVPATQIPQRQKWPRADYGPFGGPDDEDELIPEDGVRQTADAPAGKQEEVITSHSYPF